MSISASEREDWVGTEPDQMDSSGHSDLQKELMRVLSKAVQELELTWSPPEEPVRSKLDSVPFFPDVHEQLVKTWSALQSARVHSTTQAIFFHVDGAEAHGMCALLPSRRPLLRRSDINLPSKPCRTTAHLANKAYASDGEAASALHVMAVLQVFQAKLLQAAEGGALTVEAVKDIPRPAPAVGTVTVPRQEPDVRRKAWGPGKKRHGQRRSPQRDSRPSSAAKPSS